MKVQKWPRKHFRAQAGGLAPGASYDVSVSAEMVTDRPSGCFGIGGAPGESVWIKAGATGEQPLPVLEGSWLRMNIDIGKQSNGGARVVVLGTVSNSRRCDELRSWEPKAFTRRPLSAPVTASSDGRVWLLVGVDSGFEGRTEVYFTRVSAVFQPA